MALPGANRAQGRSRATWTGDPASLAAPLVRWCRHHHVARSDQGPYGRQQQATVTGCTRQIAAKCIALLFLLNLASVFGSSTWRMVSV